MPPARLAALRRLPMWLLALLGLLVGAGIGLIAAGFVTAGDDDPSGRFDLLPAPEASRADQEASRQAFLAAWRRYREATYTADLVFVRTTAGGGELRSHSTYTQAPPRRVVRSADALQLDAGADSLTCSTVNGTFTCAPAPSKEYTALVDDELAIWHSALDGDEPYYRISQPVDGCFELRLDRVLADPPYGDVARFCFDAATGALAKRQIVRTTATDTEEAIAISVAIPADAFTPPTTTR